MNRRGRPVVISAASGAGKSTIINEILKRQPDFIFSVSATTRKPRRNEVDTVHYRFITRDEFLQGIRENRFIEWEYLHDEYYGTDREWLEAALEAGKNVILNLDVKGGEHLKEIYPETILIFLFPPSIEELHQRLIKRGSEDEESINRRLERYPMETAKGENYPYRVVNDSVERSTAEVLRIISSNGKL